MSSIQGGGNSRDKAIDLLSKITENKQTQTAAGKAQIGKMQGRLMNAIKSNNLSLMDQTVRTVVKEYLPLTASKNPPQINPQTTVSQVRIPDDSIFAQGRNLHGNTGNVKFDQESYKAAVKQADGLTRRNRGVRAKGLAAAGAIRAEEKVENFQSENQGQGVLNRIKNAPQEAYFKMGATAANVNHNVINFFNS